MCDVAPIYCEEGSRKSGIDLDVAIADAREEISRIGNSKTLRSRQLARIIKNFTVLKDRRIPSDLFSVPVVRLDANR
jgi:hypothetical protein